jgi:hypothetical protein
LYLHMEASQHSLLAACFTLHSINATLAIVPQRGAGLWIYGKLSFFNSNSVVGGGIQLDPLGTSATNWPIVPGPGNYED